MDDKHIINQLSATGGTTSQRASTTQKYTQRIFDKFGVIYGNLWKMPRHRTPEHSAMVNQWSNILHDLDVSQIRYAIEYIESGQSDYSQYPPNCIQFGTLAKSFRANRKQPVLGRIKKKDWRDVAIDERVANLEKDPNWKNVVEKAKKSGQPVKYLIEWSKRHR